MEKLDVRTKVAVVGLGYVGLPLAVAFAEHFPTVGYDCSREKIECCRQGRDVTEEVGDRALAGSALTCTTDPSLLKEMDFIIVAVPTPVNLERLPDLGLVREASRTIGRNLSRGTIVCYESTVYPGVTETVCGPILEQESGLKAGLDFHLAYSPERINPGDRIHRLQNICKIVSGDDKATRDRVAALYGTIIQADLFPVSSIRVAEAAKLIENTQRDVNIAFMNEVAMACHAMGIDTCEVADAMDTKWNALHFRPGLVGGHCIGVDPYYFVYEAKREGYLSALTALSRHINEGMADYVVQETLRQMILGDLRIRRAHVVLLGLTFKADCSDLRNSKALEIFRKLRQMGIPVQATDPVADPDRLPEDVREAFIPVEEIRNAHVLLFAVRHRTFREWTAEDLQARYAADVPSRILIDVKGMYRKDEMEKAGFQYWRL